MSEEGKQVPGKVVSMGLVPGGKPAAPRREGTRADLRLDRKQLSQKVLDLTVLVRQLQRHSQVVHAQAKQAFEDSQHALSFQGLLLKTLVRKGLITEKDVQDTAEEVKKDAEARRAAVEAAKPKAPAGEAPAAPDRPKPEQTAQV